jgi:3-keto-5-aminohexanoate cleavage enzyme
MDERFKNLPPRFPWGRPPDGADFGPDGIDMSFQPKWKIPEKIGITCHVTGQPIKRAKNPHQPYTPDEIKKSAMDCIEAGATAVHIHARSAEGNFVVDKKEHIRMLHSIIDPIREKYGNGVYIDGCICVDTTWELEKVLIDEMLDTGMMDSMPINPGSITPPPLLQAEAAYLMEKGIKPGLGLHEEENIDQVRVYLIDTGILKPPLHWGLLPGWAIGGTLYNELDALDYMARTVRRIRSIDPEGMISIATAGRGSYYLTGLAILLGLSIRVGIEDTYWKWPHKDDMLTDTVTAFKDMKTVAEIFGRQMATADEYRAMVGLPTKG